MTPVTEAPELFEKTAPTYVVRVTLTVAIPYYDEHPSINDAAEDVIAALRQQKPLPEGAQLYGGMSARVRTAKGVATDARRASQRRRSA